MTVIYFIITLGILIFIHELGHFIMAKRSDIKVSTFSLGFGPRLFGFKIGETDYRVSAFPLGGYVSMLGEDPSEEGADDPRSFASKSVWARIKVASFGPIMNIILCFLLMPVVFMIGRSEPVYLHEEPVVIDVKKGSPADVAGIRKGDLVLSIDGEKVAVWETVMNKILINPDQTVNIAIERDGTPLELMVDVDVLPEINGGYIGIEPIFFLSSEARADVVSPGSPAEAAGILPGDTIVSYGGNVVSDFYDLSAKVNGRGGKESTLVVERDGIRKTLKITPTYSVENERWIIGIVTNRRGIGPEKLYRYGFFDAIEKGATENIKLARLTLDILYRLVTFKLSYKVLGGPIVIAKISAEAAASGLGHFLYFMVFLSMQLAILNLMPIPVLDGGHLLFLGIEAIIRRPVNVKIRSIANHIGFIILASFMLLITIKDVETVFGVSTWVKNFLNLE